MACWTCALSGAARAAVAAAARMRGASGDEAAAGRGAARRGPAAAALLYSFMVLLSMHRFVVPSHPHVHVTHDGCAQGDAVHHYSCCPNHRWCIITAAHG